MVVALDTKTIQGSTLGAVVRTRSLSTPIGSMRAVAAMLRGVESQSGVESLGPRLLELQTESAANQFGSTPASDGTLDPKRLVGMDFEASVQACEQLLDSTAKQLQEYFRGHRFEFDLPVGLRGTPFQMKVWEQLRLIGYSQTQTYSQLAGSIGVSRGSRAVGAALGRNPIWIILPCHRVVGKTGTLVGFAGGLDTKRYLIELEKNHSTG